MSEKPGHGRSSLTLFISVGLLMIIGLVMVFEASSVYALQAHSDSFAFLREQAMWLVIACIIGGITYKIGYKRVGRLALPIYAVGIIGCGLVFIPGIGSSANGATRWIAAGPINIQPSELLKLAMVMLAANLFSVRRLKKDSPWVFASSPLLLLGAAVLLIMFQRDLGTSLVLIGSVLCIMFASGLPMKFLGQLSGAGLSLVGLLIAFEPYRRARFLAFLNPSADPNGNGYQILQGLIAIGSGGLTGLGIGASRQKAFFLPNPHTDFIFAIIAEEFGLLASVIVIGLYGLLALSGMRIAVKAKDEAGRLMAVGMTAMITIQAIINIGGVSASLPLTGVPLPFISKGGTSLVIMMMCVGILFDIARGPRLAVARRRRGGDASSDSDGRDGRTHKSRSGSRPRAASRAR